MDVGEISLAGHRLQKIFDYGYGTDAQCAARAAGQLRKHLATARRGETATLPNPGLELFDAVTVNGVRCGISNETYRVRGIKEVYDTTKPPLVFTQTVTLAARGRMIRPSAVERPEVAIYVKLSYNGYRRNWSVHGQPKAMATGYKR